jgi:hypothetical protein
MVASAGVFPPEFRVLIREAYLCATFKMVFDQYDSTGETIDSGQSSLLGRVITTTSPATIGFIYYSRIYIAGTISLPQVSLLVLQLFTSKSVFLGSRF